MFDPEKIPESNPISHKYLSDLYNQIAIPTEQKEKIFHKLNKINRKYSNALTMAPTISEYFDGLWQNSEIKEKHKNFVVQKVEAIQQLKRDQILNGKVLVSKTPEETDKIIQNDKLNLEEECIKISFINSKKPQPFDTKTTIPLIKTDIDILRVEPNKPTIFHYNATSENSNPPNDEELKQKQAIIFVKKIKSEKEEFEKKRKKLEELAKNKLEDELERAKMKEREEFEAKVQIKREKIQASLEAIDEKKKYREIELKKGEEEYNKVIKEKQPFYMYKKLQEDYKKKVEEPELERIKKIKADLRDLYKPMDRNELLEHEKKFSKDLEQHREKNTKTESAVWEGYKKPSYESRFHKMFQEEQEKIKRAIEDERERRKMMRDSLLTYGREVKENHPPTVDKSKELEMKNLIERLDKKIRSKTADKDDDDDDEEEEKNSRSIALKWWEEKRKNLELKLKEEELKSKDAKSPNMKAKTASHASLKGSKNEKFLKDDEIAETKKSSISTKSDTFIYKKDYLPEVKKSWKHKSRLDEISSTLKNSSVDDATKMEYVKGMIDKIEENARRKEQLYKIKSKGNEIIEEDQEVDDMYINAIKAKLEILGDNTLDEKA